MALRSIYKKVAPTIDIYDLKVRILQNEKLPHTFPKANQIGVHYKSKSSLVENKGRSLLQIIKSSNEVRTFIDIDIIILNIQSRKAKKVK